MKIIDGKKLESITYLDYKCRAWIQTNILIPINLDIKDVEDFINDKVRHHDGEVEYDGYINTKVFPRELGPNFPTQLTTQEGIPIYLLF